MNQPLTEPEFACTLNDEEFKERRAWARKTLFPQTVKRERLETGLMIHFHDSVQTRSHVETFVELERQCCGFLTFTISPPGDGLSLFIEAPERARETLDRLVEAASHND